MEDTAEPPPFRLPFEPVHQVVMGRSGPLSGESDFRGVLYRFAPNHSASLQRHVRGQLYDPTPVDPLQGPPMLAEGKFQPVVEGCLEVYWTALGALGCPPIRPSATCSQASSSDSPPARQP